MPRIFSDATVRWTEPAGLQVDANATIIRDSDPAEVHPNSVDFTNASAQALQPGATSLPVVQECNPEIRLSAVKIPFDRFWGEWVYERDIGRAIQTFEFSVWTRKDDRYFMNDPSVIFAPATCDEEIEVDGVYRLSSGLEIRYPLIRKGIVDSQTRSEEGDLSIETFRVMDGSGRVGRDGVTATYPVGGGLTRDELAKQILEFAGSTDAISFAEMGATSKQLVLVDSDPLSAIADLFSVELRGLVFSPDGVFESPAFRPETGSASLTLTEDDILEMSTADYTTDAITRLLATGTREEVDPAFAGTVNRSRLTQVFRLWNGNPMRFNQIAGTGVLNALAQWPGRTATSALVSRIEVFEELRCGTLVSRTTLRYEMANPISARYKAVANVWQALSCNVADGAVQGAFTHEGRLKVFEHWRLVERIEERWAYDAAGFPNIVAFAPSGPVPSVNRSFSTSKTGNDTGFFLGSSRRVERLASRETAVKTRANPETTWETQDYTANTFIQGPLVGMDSQVENLIRVEDEYVVVDSDSNGLIRESAELRVGLARYPGWQYLYGDGSEGRESKDTFGPLDILIEQYLHREAHQHQIRVDTRNYETGQTETILETRIGPAPQVDRVRQRQPDEVLLAGSSSCVPESLQIPIEAEVLSTARESCQPRRTERVNFEGAETVDELTALSEMAIRESAEPDISITIPCNFAVREGEIVLVSWAPRDWSAAELMVRSIQTSGGWLGPPPETTISGKMRSPEA